MSFRRSKTRAPKAARGPPRNLKGPATTATPSGSRPPAQAASTSKVMLSLQDLLVCSFASLDPAASGAFTLPAGPGRPQAVTVKVPPLTADTLREAVQPLCRALVNYLDSLQRATGMTIRFVLPSTSDLAHLAAVGSPAGLGPTPTGCRRQLLSALRMQQQLEESTASGSPEAARETVTGASASADSPGSQWDPFHLTGAGSDKGWWFKLNSV